ncbi:putative HTH-type transcriptional regulator YjiR [Marinomonas spartinae]|uniref:aminotransferase-like domain-containing protein n=1 Tax=Marinomonas spartinae TaxID=1792290 RepID=UPI000808EB87|nr:PLP-dependent aminotransferase family protein [Marinomonas spartinae]SBS29986.1 putative HTH-type transcriptional regulator YjiR [Marinomonas spartinae]
MVDEALYQRIATHIRTDIQQGRLTEAMKLPSVRRIASLHNVSHLTALNALRLLENEGVVEAKPRSGFFVKVRHPLSNNLFPSLAKQKSTINSPVPSLDTRSRHLSLIGRNQITSLGLADGHLELYPVKRFSQIMRQLIYKNPSLLGSHLGGHGLPALIQQIVRRAMDYGCSLVEDEILVTNGGLESLSLALKASTSPGDKVLIQSPTYFLLLQLLKDLGLEAIEIASSNMTLNTLQLEETIDRHKIKVMVYTANFNNPDGCLLSDSDKQALVNLMVEKQVTIIEDDVYGDIYFGNTRPRPLRAFNDQVILCSSFTKTLSPGLRIGWLACAGWQDAVYNLKRTSSKVTAEFPQAAIAEFIKNGGYDVHMRKLRALLKGYCQVMREEILKAFPVGTQVSQPQGGYVLWVTLKEGSPSTRVLFEKAYAERISIVPGYLFSLVDIDSAKIGTVIERSNDLSFRINYGYGLTPDNKEAIHTLASWVKEGSIPQNGCEAIY